VVQQLVSAVMSAPVLSVTADSPLQDAVKLMSEHHISGLPVVDAAGLLLCKSMQKQFGSSNSTVFRQILLQSLHVILNQL
jgi:CBS domain-containing protein